MSWQRQLQDMNLEQAEAALDELKRTRGKLSKPQQERKSTLQSHIKRLRKRQPVHA